MDYGIATGMGINGSPPRQHDRGAGLLGAVGTSRGTLRLRKCRSNCRRRSFPRFARGNPVVWHLEERQHALCAILGKDKYEALSARDPTRWRTDRRSVAAFAPHTRG